MRGGEGAYRKALLRVLVYVVGLWGAGACAGTCGARSKGSEGLANVLGLLLVLVGRLLEGKGRGLAMLGIVADDGAGYAG